MSARRSTDSVWKALSDPVRRSILKQLKSGPKTTGQLCGKYDMTRFGVMKHLKALEGAQLIRTRRVGRERWNHLNSVPLRKICIDWIGSFADSTADRDLPGGKTPGR